MDTEGEGLAEESELRVLFTMDASTDGLVAHGQYQNFMICLLWMPQQMDLLLHTDIVIYVVVICTRLVMEAAV